MNTNTSRYNPEYIYDVYHLAKTEMDTGAPRFASIKYLSEVYNMKESTANSYITNVLALLMGKRVVTSLGASQWRALLGLIYDDYGWDGVHKALNSLDRLIEWMTERREKADSLTAVRNYWESKYNRERGEEDTEPVKPTVTKEEALDAIERMMDALNDLSDYIKEA